MGALFGRWTPAGFSWYESSGIDQAVAAVSSKSVGHSLVELGHTRPMDPEADGWWLVDVVVRGVATTEVQAAAIVEAARQTVEHLFQPSDARTFRGVRETSSYDMPPPDGSIGVSFWVPAPSPGAAVDRAVDLTWEACRQVIGRDLPLWDVRALPMEAVLSREEAGFPQSRMLRSSRQPSPAEPGVASVGEVDKSRPRRVKSAVMSPSALDARSQVRRLRCELADRFEGLEPASWDVESWCPDWRIRDVLGHLVYNAEATGLSVARDVLRNAGRADRAMCRVAQRLGDEPVPVLAGRLRAAAGGHYRVPGFPAGVGLGDLLVHSCDAFRPLGVDIEARPDEVSMALDAYPRVGRLVVHAAPHRRVTLVATDMDWRTGSGPDVKGRAIDLLLLMANRRQAIPALEGPGLSLLAT